MNLDIWKLKGLDMHSNAWQIHIWPVDYKIPSRVNFTLDADLSSLVHPMTMFCSYSMKLKSKLNVFLVF